MRITLSWIRCGLCGRRMRTYPCRIGGRVVELCPYCREALSLPGGPCGSSKASRRRRKLDLDEGLLSRIGG